LSPIFLLKITNKKMGDKKIGEWSLVGGHPLVPSPRLCGERVRVRGEP